MNRNELILTEKDQPECICYQRMEIELDSYWLQSVTFKSFISLTLFQYTHHCRKHKSMDSMVSDKLASGEQQNICLRNAL